MRNKLKLFKLMVKVGVWSICSVTLLLLIFFLGEEENIYYKYVMQDNNIRVESEPENTLVDEEDEDPVIVIPEDVIVGSGGTAIKGSGLNTLLINNITTEGYVKELLTMYSEHEKGTYSKSEKNGGYKFHASMEALLGMQVNETNTFMGTIIPKSFVPFDKWGKDYLGVSADNMKLFKFDSTTWKTINGSSSIFGAANSEGMNHTSKGETYITQFQVAYPQLLNKSKYISTINGAGNSGRTVADWSFLPDVLEKIDEYLNVNVIDALSLSDEEYENMPDMIKGSLLSSAHNRGSFNQQTYGWTYNGNGGAGVSINTAKINGFTSEQYLADASEIANDIEETLLTTASKSTFSIIASEYQRYYAVLCLLEQPGWYVSKDAWKALEDNSDKVVAVYKVLFPDAVNVNNITFDQIVEKYKDKRKDPLEAIAEVTGDTTVTKQDLETVYRIGNNNYDTNYSSSWGFVYKVRNKTSKVYKIKYENGNQPYHLSAYDIVNAGHNFGGGVLGGVIYAKLLQFSGVNIDPTNPDTYKNNLTNTTAPTFNYSGTLPNQDMLDKIDSVGAPLNTLALTEDRVKILNEAYSWIGTGTVYAGSSNAYAGDRSKKGFGADCSGFISKVYESTGHPISYMSTKDITGYSSSTKRYWEWIPYTDLSPGDIIVGVGHAMMYLSGSGTNFKDYVIIHTSSSQSHDTVKIATNWSKRSFAGKDVLYTGVKEPTQIVNNNMLYCFRYKNATFVPK